MKRLGFRPHLRLVAGLVLITLCLSAALFRHGDIRQFFVLFGHVLAGSLLLAAVIDGWRSRQAPKIRVMRQHPGSLSLNRKATFTLSVENQSTAAIQIELRDHVPASWSVQGDEAVLAIPNGQGASLAYQVTARRRGPAVLPGIEVRIVSPWRLWQRQWWLPHRAEIKVYPDFSLLNQHTALAGATALPSAGVKCFNRRGEGIEFEQLRAYREGDSLRQIDWQATSKRQALISRDYQEEQNQHVIVMLDAGKRMNISTEQGTHFDAALSGLIMLSQTVLKQGDTLSMLSFGAELRWLSAVKGAQAVSRVVNHFYDLYPDEGASDYYAAMEELRTRCPKRALVLLVTTLNDDEMSDMLPALKLLQQHHLVALINIENTAVQEALRQTPEDESGALGYAAALALRQGYQTQLALLQKEGVICASVTPTTLLPQTINTYLSVKRAGVL